MNSKQIVKGKAGRNGFTLLEVVIAIAILAVGLLMLLSLQNQTIELSSYSKNLSLAMLIAKERMVEVEMREREFTEIEQRYERMEEIYPAFRVEELEEEETLLSFLDFGEGIELKQIGVRVSWDEGRNEEEYILTTWIALGDKLIKPQ
ncbi:MAG: prepilin-type N-terminal cleavage/methylation domain-containing protein [Deltaproteobacteria bacterium]|nr:MAG: prepilin-type N-terminal cleavage/methylation domain-containing protein [Deltaproteobacteria bacterium]